MYAFAAEPTGLEFQQVVCVCLCVCNEPLSQLQYHSECSAYLKMAKVFLPTSNHKLSPSDQHIFSGKQNNLEKY